MPDIQTLKQQAKQGDAEAQFSLGTMYQFGKGVNQDYREAVRWCRLAADQGIAIAQHRLGWLYYHGDGVKKDISEAEKWFRKAADQDHAQAQFILGMMYQNGEGVLQDDKKAHMWFNIALANGSRKADEFIEIITRRMTPADISKAQDMAERCLASNYQDC